MVDQAWEEALEMVVAFLDAPPAPGSDNGQRFDKALRRVLAGGPTQLTDVAEAAAVLDPGLRARLDDLAQRRVGHNPFGEHPDGIGPTLGMDLGKA